MPEFQTHSLYPPLEPFESDFLDTGDGHRIRYFRSGRKGGKPVLFVHGGPGAGSNPKQRQFFHPDHYEIIQVDQRGCGESTPFGCLTSNTTDHLIQDFEVLRDKLQIPRWMLFGGSWGSFLTLAYAESCPDVVTELVLRGVCVLNDDEMNWCFKPGGASLIYPERFDFFRDHIPQDEQGDLDAAYHKRLVESDDPAVHRAAAEPWVRWLGLVDLVPEEATAVELSNQDVARTRLESHYFFNRGFRKNNQLIEDAAKIADKEATIVQGRYDMLCPCASAVRVHKALPKSKLVIVGDAAHSAYAPGIRQALLAATNKYAIL